MLKRIVPYSSLSFSLHPSSFHNLSHRGDDACRVEGDVVLLGFLEVFSWQTPAVNSFSPAIRATGSRGGRRI